MLLSQYISAQSIKVAITDHLTSQKLLTYNYQKYYLEGFDLEVIAAKKLGINYEYKTFFYEDPNVNIFEQVKKIKKWNPDIVVGPTFSSHFLLLKDQFTDTLVLSPYASANAVYQLPKNYYTLTVSATDSAKKSSEYIGQAFKPKTIFIFTDASCTFCVDFTNVFVSALKKKKNRIEQISFINDDIMNKQLDYKKLLKEYSKNDIIMLNTTGYHDELLISEISNSLQKNNVLYVVGDGWDMYNNWDIDNIKTNYTFNIFRVTPKVINPNSQLVKKFSKQYIQLYNNTPNAISFATFNTLNSVSDALKNYNCNLKNIKANILCSYQSAIKKNPGWHRPILHEVYEIKKGNEYFVTDIK